MSVKIFYRAGTWDYRAVVNGTRLIGVGMKSHTACVRALCDAVAAEAGDDAAADAFAIARLL